MAAEQLGDLGGGGGALGIRQAGGRDPHGLKAEFIALVDQARRLVAVPADAPAIAGEAVAAIGVTEDHADPVRFHAEGIDRELHGGIHISL